MKSYLHTFTPSEASSILDRTGLQRPLSKRAVDSLVSSIKEGRWVVNGETIILGNDGTVLDGQHRLWACVISDIPIQTWVVHGVQGNGISTIDTGRVRSNSDMVHMYLNESGLGSSLEKAVGAAIGLVQSCDMNGKFYVTRFERASKNYEIEEFLRFRPEFKDDAKRIYGNGSKKCPIPLSIAIGIYAIAKSGYPEEADHFIQTLYTDIGHNEGDPVLALRRKGLARSKPEDFRRRTDVVACTVKTWNAFVRRDQIKTVRYSHRNEDFPIMIVSPKFVGPAKR